MPPYSSAPTFKKETHETAQLNFVKSGGRIQHFGHHSAKFLAPQGSRPAFSGRASAAIESIAWQLTTSKS